MTQKFNVGDVVKVTEGCMAGVRGTIELIATVEEGEEQRYNVRVHSMSFIDRELQLIQAKKEEMK